MSSVCLIKVLCSKSLVCFLLAVDEEFEVVASQVLTRTHAMVSKYRRLLMVEAEVGTPTTSCVHTRASCYDKRRPDRSALRSGSVPVRRQRW